MKSIKINHGSRKLLFVAILAPFIFLLSSCATKMAFHTSSVVPAAEGSVKVKKDSNKNYNVNLSVKRLASPERLSPSKKMYIVWMNTSQDGVKKIGQLTTSSSLLSSTLTSSLKTSVPFEPTGFFITAEDDASIESPLGTVVLTTQ
ncbi:MAG: hypothetical protein ABI208_01290 [Ginsengibacter sp.]|jgi:hypothetical protein